MKAIIYHPKKFAVFEKVKPFLNRNIYERSSPSQVNSEPVCGNPLEGLLPGASAGQAKEGGDVGRLQVCYLVNPNKWVCLGLDSGEPLTRWCKRGAGETGRGCEAAAVRFPR